MKKSGFISDFKAFISKGNMIDMAVAVVIGGAFGKIVTSLVGDIMMPLLGLLTGGGSLSEHKWIIEKAVMDGETVVTPEVAVKWGMFLQYIIDFLIVAFCIFVVIRLFTRLKTRAELLLKIEEEITEPAPAKPTADEESAAALKEILEILKKNK